MSDDAYGATIAKLLLARKLTDLRVEAGYTANHVCDMLNWGRGKVGRFEANQWKRPEMSDIRDLLRFYQADDLQWQATMFQPVAGMDQTISRPARMPMG